MNKIHITAIAAGALALSAGAASAQPAPNLFAQASTSAVYYPASPPKLDQTQYFWGGHNYCWYDGWHGPGWYWCGYGWRSGFGWGGGYGWRGWGGHGGYRGGYGGYHGGYGGFHGGGGYHGGGGFHGGGAHVGGGGGFHGGGAHAGGGGGHHH